MIESERRRGAEYDCVCAYEPFELARFQIVARQGVGGSQPRWRDHLGPFDMLWTQLGVALGAWSPGPRTSRGRYIASFKDVQGMSKETKQI